MDGSSAIDRFKQSTGKEVSEPPRLLDGGGQMSDFMRSIEWSNTPVGQLGRWRRSLKTAVSALLKPGTAVFIFGGLAHVQFSNDAYRQIVDAETRPAAMGQRSGDCELETWEGSLAPRGAIHQGVFSMIEDGLPMAISTDQPSMVWMLEPYLSLLLKNVIGKPARCRKEVPTVVFINAV